MSPGRRRRRGAAHSARLLLGCGSHGAKEPLAKMIKGLQAQALRPTKVAGWVGGTMQATVHGRGQHTASSADGERARGLGGACA